MNHLSWRLMCHALLVSLSMTALCCVRPSALPSVGSPRGEQPTATSREVPPPQLLEDTARSAARAGAGPIQVVALGARAAGESLTGFVHLPASRCGLVYGRASPSVADLDLEAFADDGTQYGSDQAPDDLPTLLLCAEDRPLRLFLTAKVAQGQGLVALGLQDVSLDSKKSVLDAIGGRARASKALDEPDPWSSLGAELDAHLDALPAIFKPLRRVALPVDARVPTRVDAVVEHGACLSGLILPEHAYYELDLQVSDERGRVVTRGREVGKNRSFLLCNQGPKASFGLEVRPRSGQGLVLLALDLSVDPSAMLDLAPHGVTVGSLTSRPARVSSKANPRRLPLELRSGNLITEKVNSQGCQDYALLSTSTGVTPRAVLRGFTPQGRFLGQASSAWGLPLTLCARGEVLLEIDPESDFSAVLWVGQSKLDTPSLQANPLAASRALLRAGLILADMAEWSSPTIESRQLSQAELLLLGRVPTTQRCFSYVVGVSDDTGWLDIRVVTAEDHRLVGRAQGQSSAGLEVCRSAVTEETQVEIRREGAPTTGLILFYERAKP